MATKQPCSYLTNRGRPCRNPARPGTRPPACARHRHLNAAAGQPSLPTLAPPPYERPPRRAPSPDADSDIAQSHHFYFPHPTAAEQSLLAATAGDADLRPEVDLVRIVLRRLLAYLDEAAGELPADELRRVSGLVFSGARTVALLLGHPAARAADTQPWLDAVLGEMAGKYPGMGGGEEEEIRN